jgi:hypothetical protein
MIKYKKGFINYILLTIAVIGTISYLSLRKVDINIDEKIDNQIKIDARIEPIETSSTIEKVNLIKTNNSVDESVVSQSNCLGKISSQTTPSNLNALAVNIAKKFLSDRLGGKYYNCNISLNTNNGGPENPWNKSNTNYLVYFKYEIPNTTVSATVQIIPDIASGIAKLGRSNGVPVCASNQQKCEFRITSQQAVLLAESNGVRKGSSATFTYSEKTDSWVWKVTEKNSLSCPLKTLSVDTHNGKISDTELNPCTPPPSTN